MEKIRRIIDQIKKICKGCGNEFDGHIWQKYCDSCRGEKVGNL